MGLKHVTQTTKVIGVLLASACAPLETALPPCDKQSITYKYPGEESIGEKYKGQNWWRINSDKAPESDAKDLKVNGHPDFNVFYEVVDCSVKKIACARTFEKVFAVPLGEWVSGFSYRIAGADVSIEGCLVGAASGCNVGVFVSDCRQKLPTTVGRSNFGMVIGDDCRKTGWGQQTLFIADRVRGVIAYEQADWWEPGTDLSRWDLSSLGVTAGMMALVEDRGLLSCRLALVGQ